MSTFLKLASDLQTRINYLTDPIIDQQGDRLPGLSIAVLEEAFKVSETMKSQNPLAIITFETLNTLNGIHSEFSRKVEALSKLGMLDQIMDDSSTYSNCWARKHLDHLKVRYRTIHDRLCKGEIDNETFKKFPHQHLHRDALEIILDPARAQESELTQFDLLKIMSEPLKGLKVNTR